MRVADSNLVDLIEDVLIDDFGYYYFFDGFVISEIHEGVIYNWEASQAPINGAYEHYGPNLSVCYISNRVNQYSIKPTDWIKFFRHKHPLNGYATVNYTEQNFLNALLEKVFLKTKVERFENLYDAINWAQKCNIEVDEANFLKQELERKKNI